MPGVIRVELLSDTTFSRGEGMAGEVDVEVVHDACGLPVLPGRTLRGLLRESWLGLRHSFGGYEHRAREILGVSRDLAPGGRSRLRIEDARLPAEVRAWAEHATRRKVSPVSPHDLLHALTDVRRQTARDRATGAPRDETLRESRVVLQGLELEAPLSAEGFDDLDWEVLTLMCLGVRHAGLGRNRGRGHLRLHLVDGDRDRTAELADRFRALADAGPKGSGAGGGTSEPGIPAREGSRVVALPGAGDARDGAPGPAGGHSTAAFGTPGDPGGERLADPRAAQPGPEPRRVLTRFYRYRLTLQAPLIVPTLEGDPNSVRSSVMISGGTIRGAVAARLGASDPRFSELVLSGDVRYLNAYPLPEGAGGRSIPTPVPWQVEKYDPGTIHDLSHADLLGSGTVGLDDLPQVEALSGRAPYVTAGAEPIEARPATALHFHHQRDRALGRATEQAGAIFTYEAISEGTRFSGVIAVSGDTDDQVEERARRIRSLLEQPVLLGRSRRTQYGGRAEVAWDGDGGRTRELDGWSELLSGDLALGDRFRVLLTADAISRDPETGQPDPGSLGQAVVRALGGRATCVRTLGRATVVAGFNATWRLPLPQAPAAAAGTVLVLEAREAIALGDLLEVERQGIGERLVEGLGACAFLKPAERSVLTVKAAAEQSPPPAPSGDVPPLLREAQGRLWAAAVSGCVEKHAAKVAGNAAGIPSRSLLGRLRAPLREGEPGLRRLAEWLGSDDQTKLRRPAARALEHCRVLRSEQVDDGGSGSDEGGVRDEGRPPAGMDLDRWLRATLRTSEDALDELAHDLFGGASLEPFTLTGALDAATRRRLARLARGELVDAVLATLARRAGDGSQRRVPDAG